MNQQAVVLLHGALGAASQFDTLHALLDPDFDVYRFDFEGHGEKSIPSHPFRIENFAENLEHYLDAQGLDQPNVFGFSMGGYVALYLAAQKPGIIRKIFTLGTKFAWTPESARKEARMLDPAKIEEKVPQFARMLSYRHTGDWKEVCHKTAEMMGHLGQKDLLRTMDFSGVTFPATIGKGEKDNMVTDEESIQMAQALPNGNFKKFSKTPHPLEKVDGELLANALREFFGVKQ